MIPKPLTALASCLLAAGCTLPRPAAVLPDAQGDDGGYVAAVSGQFYPPLDEVSRSAWLVVHTPGRRTSPFTTYENGSAADATDPFRGYGGGDVMIHGRIAYGAQELAAKSACLAEASRGYRQDVGAYRMFPGPNANTYAAYLLRKCGIPIELPSTAIGKDWVGWVGAARTEGGTGVVLAAAPLALRLGLKEGVEVQLATLPVGVHFWPPGITVPVNPGRIGFATDAHRREPDSGMSRPVGPHEPLDAANRVAASVQLVARAEAARSPGAIDGYRGAARLGMSARAVDGGRLGYGVGFDFDMGVSAPLGYALSAHLFPIGVGYTISPTGFVGLFSGIGTWGTTNRMPFALELPQEARFEVDAGTRARLVARAQLIGVSAPDEPWRMDFAFGTYARFAPLRRYEDLSFASGYFFGIEQRLMHGDPIWGLVFGSEIAIGVRRPEPAPPPTRPPLYRPPLYRVPVAVPPR